MADAAAEQEWRDSRRALWDGWKVDFSPEASGPLYPEPAYCVAYWQNKVNGAAPGAAYARARRNLYDVCHGTLLKIEEPATNAGRPLYLYPDGYPPRSEV